MTIKYALFSIYNDERVSNVFEVGSTEELSFVKRAVDARTDAVYASEYTGDGVEAKYDAEWLFETLNLYREKQKKKEESLKERRRKQFEKLKKEFENDD